MKVSKEEVNQILEEFTSNDEYRDWMNSPVLINDICIATDAHILLIVPKQYCSITNNLPEEKHLNVLNIIPPEKNTIKEINVDYLSVLMDKIPLVDEYINAETDQSCKTCDGDGNVEWVFEDYDKYDDCPVCYGEGTITKEELVKTGYKVKDFSKFTNINGSIFNTEYVYKMCELAKKINAEKIKLVFSEKPNRASLFKINDFKVLLMPVVNLDKEILYTL